MGVNSDLTNPRPFVLGGTGDAQSRIRQQANNAKARGLNQIRAFKQLTETGGTQAKYPEVARTQTNPQVTPQQQQIVSAGEKLRTHSKLIDNLVSHIMFG